MILHLLADYHEPLPIWFTILIVAVPGAFLVYIIYEMVRAPGRTRRHKEEQRRLGKIRREEDQKIQKLRREQAESPRPFRRDSSGHLKSPRTLRYTLHEFEGSDLDFLKQEPKGEVRKLVDRKRLVINSHNSSGAQTNDSNLWSDFDAPIVYIVRNDVTYKIGISKTFNRFSDWLEDGWNWIACISTDHLLEPTAAVFRIESALLRHYRSIGACPDTKAAAHMKDGGSETLIPEMVEAEEIVHRAIKEFADAEAQYRRKKVGSQKSSIKHELDGTYQSLGTNAAGPKTTSTPRGSIQPLPDGTYRAVWEGGKSADGKRRRNSKSGFVSQAEAQRYIDDNFVSSEKSYKYGAYDVGYVSRLPSKKLDNFAVIIYIGEPRFGNRQTKTLGRWKTRKAAEAALARYTKEQGL